jgi:hypothetical protein
MGEALGGARVQMPDVKILSDYSQVPTEGISGRYVASLMRHGATFYIENTNVSIQALIIDGKIFPLAINPGTSHTSYVCSPYAHYLSYSSEEFSKRHSLLPVAMFRALALPFGALLRSTSIDRVVFINNWLFSTNPSPELSCEHIRAATHEVLREYPDFAIVFRSVNSLLDQSLSESLLANDYRLVRSRRVYVLDGAKKRHLAHYNCHADLKFLKRSPYGVVTGHEMLEKNASRMADLYRALYLSKHSRLNPHLNSEFFLLTLKENVFTFMGLEKDGRIDGFVTYFVQGDRMTGAVLGYELGLPQNVGLYRLLMAMLISEAGQRGLQLNLSAGVGHFKMLRGAVPVEEYDAVYDRHLPAHRRLAWTALRMCGRLGSKIKPPSLSPRQG